MISDVLFEAREELVRYLQEMPETYEGLEAEILDLCDRMQSLLQYLDNPVTTERQWTAEEDTP